MWQFFKKNLHRQPPTDLWLDIHFQYLVQFDKPVKYQITIPKKYVCEFDFLHFLGWKLSIQTRRN